MFCKKCGAKLADDAQFCTACGTSVNSPGATLASNREVAPAEDEELYRAVIGPRNQDYYWRHFSKFIGENKTSMSWHWPAFFVTFYWLLYRKMWMPALAYFFLPYPVMLVLGVIIGLSGGSEAVTSLVSLLYVAAIFFVPPLFANAWYFNRCKKQILNGSAATRSRERLIGELSGRGGTSSVWLFIFLIFGFVAFVGILAAVSIPAYQAYVTKAKVAAALETGRKAATRVEAYYEQNNVLPVSVQEAGFAEPLPKAVTAITIEKNGTLSIGIEGLGDKNIMLVPSADAGGPVEWRCVSDTIPSRLLPKQCESVAGD